MLYNAFKQVVFLFFNLLNRLMFGNLPPCGCACVIVEEQNRFLVIRRPDGKIVFPGGFMRWNETAKETARREAREETGLDLQIEHMTGYGSMPSKGLDQMSTLTIIFQASVIGGELRGSIEGEACWVDEETLHLRMHENAKPAFDDYLYLRNQTPSSS